MIEAALFDFGDTLFYRQGGSAAVIEAGHHLGGVVDEARAVEVWASIQARARTAEELAKGRDLSPQAHRSAWTDLYAEADVFAPGMGELLYQWEVDPFRWHPFADTKPTLSALRDAGIRLGVVSDTGWDIRPIFEQHGYLDWLGAIVLSFEHGAAKPAPALFHAACDGLGVRADRAIMVGDNPLTDGGAVGVGMPALILPAAMGEVRGLDAVVRLAVLREEHRARPEGSGSRQ